MPDTPSIQEALLIVDSPNPDQVLSQAGELVRLTQRLPPRLAIIVGESSQLEAVRDLPGVVGVFEAVVPDSVLQRLNPTERLFAEAWVAGRQPKSRPGEGLPWDAGGYEPP